MVSDEIRFTCLDGKPLGGIYSASFSDIFNHTQRIRELTIQSLNGTLSTTDRGYIQDEIEALLSEMNRVVGHTSYRDIFGDYYEPMMNGIQFKLAYPSHVSPGYLVSQFDFPPINLNVIGQLAKETFNVSDPRLNPGDLLIAPNVNGIDIEAPRASDDTVSYDMPWGSSVAWARKINEKQYLTKVQANAEDTILALKIAENEFPIELQTLKINNVTVSATQIRKTQNLIDSVNDFSNSTGVKARFSGYATDAIDLYAEDGRNISIDLGNNEKLARLFSNQLPSMGRHVIKGQITLRSNNTIDIEDVGGVLGGHQNSFRIEVDGPGLNQVDVTTLDQGLESFYSIDSAIAQLRKIAILSHRLVQACGN